MRFVGRGHPAVRATHDKTLELAPGDDLTERGTCIVAVDARAEPPRALAGPITVTIAAGAFRFVLDAVANPGWDPAGPVVVRRSPLRLPGTFATEADASAADLPPELVGALRDPATEVVVDVQARATDEPVTVLYLADATAGADARLAAEVAVADVVLAEDPDALRLTGRHQARVGPRTLVVATRGLPGRTAPGRDDRVETVGLPPELAVAAASPTRGPVLTVPPGDDPREAIRRAPGGHRVILTVPAAELATLLATVAQVRPVGYVTLAQAGGRPVTVTPLGAERALIAGGGPVAVCLPSGAAEDAPDPAVRAAVQGLLADGVPTKTAAKALAALTGWERRRAYDTVLGWRAT